MRMIIAILIFIAISNKSYTCDCKEFTKAMEFDNSDLVFIGTILEMFDDHFFIKPIEVFKGSSAILDSTYKAPFGDCLINPNTGERWLIYANTTNKGIIKVSTCGYSRSFSFPYYFGKNVIPPPVPPETPKVIEILIDKVYLSEALHVLNFDIQNLRKIRLQEEISILKKETNVHIKFIKWLLVSIVTLLLLLFLMILKIGFRNTIFPHKKHGPGG